MQVATSIIRTEMKAVGPSFVNVNTSVTGHSFEESYLNRQLTSLLVFAFLVSVCTAASGQENTPAKGTNTAQGVVTGTNQGNATSAISPTEDPPYRGLDSNLYIQVSAEYRACCLQAFRWADRIVTEKVSVAGEKTKPCAVVLDLDETVLDNGVYQAQQIRDKAAFDPEKWKVWEDTGADDIRLVPGAKKFIDRLKTLGVQPVYITNRNARSHAQTMSALKRLGIEVPAELLLMADEQTGSNKTSRREQVESKFLVLAFVGDNLRDFDERFKYDKGKGIQGRFDVVEELESKFGVDWIVLPNPAYGEWTKALTNTSSDTDLLYKSK